MLLNRVSEIRGQDHVLHCFHKEDIQDKQTGPGLGHAALPGIGEGAGAMSKKQRFASVWDAIEDTPVEAENMKLRSELLLALKSRIAQSG